MAKTKQGKPKPQAKKPSAKPTDKAPRKTAEQLSDDQRMALLFSHKRKLVPLLAAEASAKAAVTKAFEFAKKEGIPKKEIKLAIALETDEGKQAARNDYEAQRRIARWMGVRLGASKDMFAEQYFDDGKRAALDDQARKPPKHLAVKDADKWMAGYDEGRQALNVSRATGGFKTLGEAAEGVLPLAPANGGAEAVDSLTAH